MSARTGLKSGEVFEILLVEDNEDDASLTMEILEEEGAPCNVTWVEDGVEALAFLRREGRHAAAPRPALILLDLSLPTKGGLEVLAEVKQDANLRRIPVVILSHSTAARDILESYNRHANCYVTKTGDMSTFHNALKQLERFWLTVVKLPKD